jgi:hypothetical protein
MPSGTKNMIIRSFEATVGGCSATLSLHFPWSTSFQAGPGMAGVAVACMRPIWNPQWHPENGSRRFSPDGSRDGQLTVPARDCSRARNSNYRGFLSRWTQRVGRFRFVKHNSMAVF